jgi:hypothetical protein
LKSFCVIFISYSLFLTHALLFALVTLFFRFRAFAIMLTRSLFQGFIITALDSLYVAALKAFSKKGFDRPNSVETVLVTAKTKLKLRDTTRYNKEY